MLGARSSDNRRSSRLDILNDPIFIEDESPESADMLTRLLAPRNLKKFACVINLPARSMKSTYAMSKEVANVSKRFKWEALSFICVRYLLCL
jgi:hypothetical protein